MTTDVVRWGILGAAGIARSSVIPAIRHAREAELAAVASRDLAKAGRAATPEGARAYGSYGDLVADPEVDAIYIPLPNHLHRDWAIRSLEAGKHVLCEKPLALDRGEAEEMVLAAASAGRLLMEAFMYRCHPQWERTLQILASGRIGDVRYAHAWFSYPPLPPDDIRYVAQWGGGALLDVGCYCVSSLRGVFNGDPTAVHALAATHPSAGVDVLTSGLLEFGARHGTFTCGTEQDADQGLRITGTGGTLTVERPFNPWDDRDAAISVSRPNGDEHITIGAVDHYRLMVESFGRSITEGTPLAVPSADSLANAAVLDAVRDAAGIG